MKEKSIIRKFNRIKNLNEIFLSKEAKIDSKNFVGGPDKASRLIGSDFKKQNLFIGERSSVLRSNYFDVVREIKIGSNVIFGGNGSEIWTHGFDTQRVFLYGGVEFGDDIFIGSKCIFTKGISVCDEVSIGSASVIYKSILEKGLYTSHKMEKIK
jgi:acetyltransferase-like isoleucine patch superfamily enzyme